MIITCPNCQTKYQVTYEAIGSAGRKVQCASCHQSWQQAALPADPKPDLRLVPSVPDAESDKLFENMAEDALDAAIETEEKSVVGDVTRPIDPVEVTRPAQKRESAAEVRERQKALSRRQNAMVSRLPMARLRRYARGAGAFLIVALLAGAYFGRVPIVERNPDLAGIYQAVGLGVNVVGLELSTLQSMRQLSEGKEVLVVSAQIVGLKPDPVAVPPVLVSLLDAQGHPVYEWSVAPRIRDLMAGERATFDTRLPLPPPDAARVRISFAGGRSSGSGGEQAPPPPSAPPQEAHGEAGAHEPAPSPGGMIPPHEPAPEQAHGAPQSPVEASAPAVHH
ncbi:hypothetical protein VW35_11890 [Devosia soli]|uniref:Zinc finger/thioredoxin putative domain-containing protein n=1 Tax=Devosia soli TaxID=361041 RepID=A0A0F5L7Z9_9HYPH|nr:MJ0042-type zinc finger domain-containing protein [Devosia soli]KKB78329.1 hypothetical protein VW35_11890 [Devosia soli]